MSDTIHVSTLDELYAGLASATGGEVFALAGGDYGKFSLGAKSKFNLDLPDVTITSADADDPAIFSGVGVRDVSGLTFDGLIFDYTFAEGDPRYHRPFDFTNSSDITIRNSVFDGDLAHGTGTVADGFGSGYALSLRGTSGFVIENNEFHDFTLGLVVSSSSDLQVIGNDLHAMSRDGMNFAAVSDVLIEGNHLHDFHRDPEDGGHPDFIQFWTNGTTVPNTDVVIRGNILDIGEGDYTQSIFMRNEEVDTGRAGQEMFYRNILIEDNLITNAHSHGISVGETDGLVIRNNSVLHADGGLHTVTGSPVEIPKIYVNRASTDVVIEDNITASISGHDGQAGWSVTGNLFVQDGSPLMPGWYGDVFVDSTLTAEDGAHRFILLPGSDAALAGVGSSLSHADAAGIAARFHVSEGETAASRIYDAGIGMGEHLPEGAIIEWDFGDGTRATGPVVEHAFAAGGTYQVTMNLHLPDGTILSRTAETGIAGSQLVELGRGGFITYARDDALLSASHDLADGLQLGAPGIAASISSKHIQPLLRTDEFTIDLSLAADTIGTSGEVFRIHTGITGSVNGAGEFRVSIWNTAGQETRLIGQGVAINDGAQHDISIRVADGQASLIVDGHVLADDGFSGAMRMQGSRDLVFGEPWGKANFHGDLTGFRITIDESAYAVRPESSPVDPDPPPAEGSDPTPMDPTDPEPIPDPVKPVAPVDPDPDPDQHGASPAEPAPDTLRALNLPVPEAINQGGLQLGAPGVAASIGYYRLGGLLSSEDFRIDLTVTADQPGSAGELFRIHTGITATVDAQGELVVSIWDQDGAATRLVTQGAGLGDGATHDVAIRLDEGRLSLSVDGNTSAEGDFAGLIQVSGTRNLDFGNPWGGSNFEGKLTGFEISVAQPDPVETPRPDPEDEGLPDLLDTLDLALPDEIGTGGLRLGAPGVAGQIGRGDLVDLLASDDFRIDLTLAASEFGSAGEVFRIHTGVIASVTTRGELALRVWDGNGDEVRLTTSGAQLADGRAHDVSIRLEDGRISLSVDGNTSAETDFVGTIHTSGGRDLTFGEPWGGVNFEGNLTAFEIAVARPEPAPVAEGMATLFSGDILDPSAGLMADIWQTDATESGLFAADRLLAELQAADEFQIDPGAGAGMGQDAGGLGGAFAPASIEVFTMLNLDTGGDQAEAALGDGDLIAVWELLPVEDHLEFRTDHAPFDPGLNI